VGTAIDVELGVNRAESHVRRTGALLPVSVSWIHRHKVTLLSCLCLFLWLRSTSAPRARAEAVGATEEELAAGAHPHPKLAGLTDLIVVAGHAVYVGNDFRQLREPGNWYLEEYQRRDGVVESFLTHIERGVEEVSANSKAVLLFSGGATREHAGPLSEALSYYRVAGAAGFFGHDAAVRGRVHTEEYARDSLENLLFSLCRFHELTGGWPNNVTVVGYDFKAERFTQYHRAALDYPAQRFHYIGTPLPPDVEAGAVAGEHEVISSWADDPYGCGQTLRGKREARDPFARGVPYIGRCASLHALLTHCGPEPYAGILPWS